MAFPSGLKVLGPAFTSVAEGLQAVPQYIDKDEELQERHEDRLARRELRPLTLEEARLRLDETRRKLTQPKVQSLGQGNYAITNPDGTIEVRSIGGIAGGETAYMRNLRGLITMSQQTDNPQIATVAKGILEQRAGIRTPAQVQMFRQYFDALDRGEQPSSEVEEYVRQTQNRYMRQPEAGAGYSPVYPPMPGASVRVSPATPAPAPGGAAPAQPGTSRTAPRTAGGPPVPGAPPASPMEQSYANYFRRAGRQYAQEIIEGMTAGNHPSTEMAMRGFLRAYPTQMEMADTLPPAPTISPGGRPGTVPVSPEPSGIPGSGHTQKYLATTTAAERRAKGLPAYTHDEVAVAKRLHARGIIPSSDLATMDDANFTKIQDYLDARKQEPLFQRRVKEAEPQIAALDAIEMAEKVSGDIYPLLNWRSVGLGGFLSNAWQTATSAIGAYKDPNDKKTLTQAVDATRRVIDLAKTRGDINQVLAENPQAAQDMMNPSAPTVRVLAAVLAYLHASAIKKGASSGSRNVAVTDVRLANELFDPVAWTSSPSAIREKLVALQTSYLRPEKKVVEKALTLKGIDPVTRKPVKGFHFGADPGGDVQPRTGSEILDDIDESN